MNNFYLRILTSFLLAPLFLYIIFLNNFYFVILLSLIFLIAIYEIKFLFKKNFFHLFFCLCILFLVFVYSFFKLRGHLDQDYIYLFWFLLTVWMSDIGGYFFGKLIGGFKLSKWSPKKTYSGLFGSLLFSQSSFLFISFSSYPISYSFKVFWIQFVIFILSVLGDLFFSYIKRKNNIKDYSSLIPGHGGLLDRVDGLIFVIIFLYMFKISNV